MSLWDGANSICLVYLPLPIVQWVGSLRLERRFLSVLCSDFITSASAATSLFQVHCQEVLEGEDHLVPLRCWQKKKRMTQQFKAGHHLVSDSSSSLLSTGWKLSATSVSALEKGCGFKPALEFSFINLGWSHLALTCTWMVFLTILRRAAQVEA